MTKSPTSNYTLDKECNQGPKQQTYARFCPRTDGYRRVKANHLSSRQQPGGIIFTGESNRGMLLQLPLSLRTSIDTDFKRRKRREKHQGIWPLRATPATAV